MAGFLRPLRLEYLDGHVWKVIEPFTYAVGAEDSGTEVIIPAGFFTDFASVPRIMWSVMPPTGSYGKAAVVHDHLYQFPFIDWEKGKPVQRHINRKDCDDIFYEAMTVLEVGWWTRSTMYSGVRVGGWKPWREYRTPAKTIQTYKNAP